MLNNDVIKLNIWKEFLDNSFVGESFFDKKEIKKKR